MQLTMIRHGETDWNIQRRFQGSSNNSLNQKGEDQANCLAGRLADESFDAIYVSDLTRAQQTAKIALGERFTQAKLDMRLREVDFGKFEGLTYKEIEEQYPVEWEAWKQDGNQGIANTEPYTDVMTRVRSFYDELRQTHPTDDECVLIIGHGGIIGIILTLALGTSPEKWWQFKLENTGIAKLDIYESEAILMLFNDYHHLPMELRR